MAKGLKLGDTVTVREDMRMPRKSEAYAQGIKRLKPGELGRIVDIAEGRSVVVEFDGGKRVKLASQRLERAAEPSAEVETNGKRKGGDTTTLPDEAKLIDYDNPNLITTVANRLLLNGGLQVNSDAVVVQIKLSDLPGAIQKQVKTLMQAKLALSPQQGSQQPKRRGRKPKNSRP
jgi:hypothetical protein